MSQAVNTGADVVQGTAQDVNQAVKLELTESLLTPQALEGQQLKGIHLKKKS